jgi:Leucine-rich repeat (LRR) protein
LGQTIIDPSFAWAQTQDQRFNFSHYFHDTTLANFVAERLHKKVTDPVSTNELAAIRGDFNIGVIPISDLKGIGYLTGIDSFHCYKNDVTELPAEIGKLRSLKYLDLNKAFDLKNLPKEIGDLQQLTMIRLSLTAVEKIPKEIGRLKHLKTLWICCNKIKEIPKEIGDLSELEELDISSNKIKVLPPEINSLRSLRILLLAHCGLSSLPENIGNLKNLENLNLFGNNLKYLPKSIANLSQLKRLNVYDNFQLNENYKNYLPTQLRK